MCLKIIRTVRFRCLYVDPCIYIYMCVIKPHARYVCTCTNVYDRVEYGTIGTGYFTRARREIVPCADRL